MQYWQQCAHAGHNQKLPLGPWYTNTTISEPVFVPLSCFLQGWGAQASLPTSTAWMLTFANREPTHLIMDRATTCVLITCPSQTLNHPPSTSIALDGVHCLPMLTASLFNLWVSSCPSLHSQGGARTLEKCWAVTFTALLKTPGQQWKSLWLLSIQIQIKVANGEKLKGYHWVKPKCYNMASLASQNVLPWATFSSNGWYLSAKRYSYCIRVFQIIE